MNTLKTGCLKEHRAEHQSLRQGWRRAPYSSSKGQLDLRNKLKPHRSLSVWGLTQELLHLRAWNNFGGSRHAGKVEYSPWPCRMVKCSSNSQNPPAWCGACRSWGGHSEHISCRQIKKHFSNLVAQQTTAIQQPQGYPQKMEVGAQKADALSVQHEEKNLSCYEPFAPWKIP